MHNYFHLRVCDDYFTTSLNSVLGTTYGCTSLRCMDLCSKAYANEIRVVSLNLAPRKLMPNPSRR